MIDKRVLIKHKKIYINEELRITCRFCSSCDSRISKIKL